MHEFTLRLLFYFVARPLLWPSGKASAQDAGGRGFDPRPSQSKDLKIVISSCSVDALHEGVSAKTGWPGVSIM